MESRTNSALFKRAEQLRRWEESDTNREPPSARTASRRIQFSDGCVFLSACAAGDKEEVLKLIRQGADIDTPNVDGLTALHQACIDDNLDMVEFLVEHGADINRGDHEGWTPLHATASCGFLSIARYLIEHNSDVAAVNNDGELPIDIAETEAMEELLERETTLRGIDCDAARSQEERHMLTDVARWLDGDLEAARMLQPHPRTGATPLHVAAAKGYIRVMSMLVQGGVDLSAQDLDGWTPLHASAHWGQREACQLLCENMADMEIRNYVGQTCFDVADPDILRLLEECKKRQAIILRERPEVFNNRGNAKNTSPKRRTSVTRNPHQTDKGASHGTDRKVADKVPGAAIIIGEDEKENNKLEVHPTPASSSSSAAAPAVTTAPLAVPEITLISTATLTTPAKAPSGPPSRPPPPPSTDADAAPTTNHPVIENDEEVPSWRRPGSFRARQSGPNGNNNNASSHLHPQSPTKLPLERDGQLNRSVSQPLPVVTAIVTIPSVTSNNTSSSSGGASSASLGSSSISSSTSALSTTGPDAEVTLRRAHSFESDERRASAEALLSVPAEQTTTATLVLSQPNQSSSSSSSSSSNQPVRRSFVPPVRDEESETQRKAHAKRVRETRRSTQGVTLEEVKSAEQLAKKKQAETSSTPTSDVETTASTVITATATVSGPAGSTDQQQQPKSELERRPSWRLCINDNNKNKFSLEDSRIKNNGGGGGGTDSGSASTITIPLRRSKALEDVDMKETSKDNAAATPATIQRRRRPKRRSTGVVQIDMEDIDPSGKDSTSSSQPGDSEPHSDDSESLSDRGSSSRQASRPSSLGSSISDIRDEQQHLAGTSTPNSTTSSSTGGHHQHHHQQNNNARTTTSSSAANTPTQPTPISAHPVAAAAAALASGAMTPNGDIDYKKLWEESQVENERLRDRLRATHEDLTKCKEQLDNAFQVSNARNAMTEAEKRERRALERKLSEMEEELKESHKMVELLRSDISKMRDENGALIRVISKLSK